MLWTIGIAAVAWAQSPADGALNDLTGLLQLTDEEVAELRPELVRWVVLEGDLRRAVGLVVVGFRLGCESDCLSALVRASIEGLERGMADGRAVGYAVEALHDTLDARDAERLRMTPAALGAGTVTAMRARIDAWVGTEISQRDGD